MSDCTERGMSARLFAGGGKMSARFMLTTVRPPCWLPLPFRLV